jgi:hypothetical protein
MRAGTTFRRRGVNCEIPVPYPVPYPFKVIFIRCCTQYKKFTVRAGDVVQLDPAEYAPVALL